MWVSSLEGPADAGPFTVTRVVPEYEPLWHWKIYREASHTFPTLDGARMFAKGWSQQWPTATITISEV